MNLHELVSQLIVDTKGLGEGGFWSFTHDSSLGLFCPEMLLCVTIVLVLLARLVPWTRRIDTAWIALGGAFLAFAVAAPWRLLTNPEAYRRVEIFTGMLVYDGFSVFMRGLLLGFLVLFVLFTRLSGVPNRAARPDIYVLVLGASLGFCLMVSANHLLMVFMAVEMASVPSYVLAGMSRRSRRASEAALKYAVYGAGTAGIMLYGISLIAGLTNSVHLPTVAIRLSEQLPVMAANELTVLTLGCLMIVIGLAFKLSAVPFHFWCPDVFEGATAEIGGFLSVASKAAALTLLLRVVVGFGTIAPADNAPDLQTIAIQDAQPQNTQLPIATNVAGLFSVTDDTLAGTTTPRGAATDDRSAASSGGLERVRVLLTWMIAVLAIVTCTFGNLAAYGQTNIKRMLAYSTIAHAGYMMMAIPPMLALIGVDLPAARFAAASLAVYVFVYLFMNLGAFAIVAFMRNRMRSEQIADYSGLLRRSPGIAICFSIILLSLVGLPPLSGFLGKFAIFAALMDGFRFTGQSLLMVLLVVGGLNSAVSLFYYLRVVKTMTMDSASDATNSCSLPIRSLDGAFVCLLTIPTAALIVTWEPLMALAIAAAQSLFA